MLPFAFLHELLSGSESWGKKKKYFYGGNPNEERRGDDDKLGDDEEDEAELEARESAKLQIKQLELLDEEDFLDAFAVSEPSSKKKGKKSGRAKDASADGKTTVKLDISNLSKREKVKLFERESPEFDGIVADFEQKMEMARAQLVPVAELIDEGRIPEGPAADYVKAKLSIVLSYCSNIACYLMFKTRRTPLRFHPVTGRLVQYKQLLDEMAASPVDSSVMEQGRGPMHLLLNFLFKTHTVFVV